VELNFLASPDLALSAAALDRLRGRLEAGFGLPPHRLWLTVTVTAEARWT
jgi:predicted Co/Zn/Cd cation transporter (cation efflux family)